MIELHRKNTYQNKIIFIDGMWRCGKSLLTPLVGAVNNVDKVKFDYHSEWISVLNFLGKVDLNTTKILLNMYADLTTYNNFLGRELHQVHTKTRKITSSLWIGYAIEDVNILTIRDIYLP